MIKPCLIDISSRVFEEETKDEETDQDAAPVDKGTESDTTTSDAPEEPSFALASLKAAATPTRTPRGRKRAASK